MLRKLRLHRFDAVVWAVWLALVAGFSTLVVGVHHQHPLPFDQRVTLWVQDLERIRGVPEVAAFANGAGDLSRVAAFAAVLFCFLIVRRLRFEALIVAGVVAVRGLQLSIRHTIDWPAGQAEYFYTTRALPDGGSFPSGHVLGETLVYGLLFWFAPRLVPSRIAVIVVRSLCALVIALGGPARLYAGAHWPSDVIGSMLLAALYLIPVLWLDARRRVPTEDLARGPLAAKEGEVAYMPTISRPASSTFGTSERSPTTSV